MKLFVVPNGVTQLVLRRLLETLMNPCLVMLLVHCLVVLSIQTVRQHGHSLSVRGCVGPEAIGSSHRADVISDGYGRKANDKVLCRLMLGGELLRFGG